MYPAEQVFPLIGKQEIERQFSPSQWARRLSASQVVQEHTRIVTEVSQDVKENIPNQLDISYGESTNQKMDLFGFDTLPEDSPILVYVHGGCWQELDRTISSYCVEPLFRNKCTVAVVGYDLAPQVSLDEIVRQIEKAADYILQLAQKRNSKGVFFAGHSAGAHLVATLSNSQFLNDHPEFCQLIKGFIYIGGLFDLRQIILTYVNDALGLSDISAVRNSPLLHVRLDSSHLAHIHNLVTVGEYESPEFQRQSRRYAEILKERGLPVTHTIIPAVDHFNLVENLRDVNYSLTKMILQLIAESTTAHANSNISPRLSEPDSLD